MVFALKVQIAMPNGNQEAADEDWEGSGEFSEMILLTFVPKEGLGAAEIIICSLTQRLSIMRERIKKGLQFGIVA